jgi:hypothetical protein
MWSSKNFPKVFTKRDYIPVKMRVMQTSRLCSCIIITSFRMNMEAFEITLQQVNLHM